MLCCMSALRWPIEEKKPFYINKNHVFVYLITKRALIKAMAKHINEEMQCT